MPRKRDRDAPRVVHRTARCGLRVTRAQRERCFGLLRSAGDAWCAVLELNRWHRARRDMPLVSCQELFAELTASGPGTFGELDVIGGRSVLRRYSDAWFATAKRRRDGDLSARYPRRKRALVPVRWYSGTFTLDRRLLQIPTARGCPPLTAHLDRDVPYPAEQVRSVSLGFDDGRLYLDVTAEVPVATYPEGTGPDPARVAGVDLGIIHPYAAADPDEQLLISGRAIRAECRQHLRDRKGRSRAAARRAPNPGQRRSRRWRQHKRRQRQVEARHLRRVRQAQHEAAKTVVAWAVEQRVGTLAVGDPRGVLDLQAGRRHNQRVRDWRVGHLIRALRDRAEAAGITVELVDERGTSSTCQVCTQPDVTPGDGPHHGRPLGSLGRHRPAPNGNRRTGSRSPDREEPASRRPSTGELTGRCTSPPQDARSWARTLCGRRRRG
jgi:IS605 OrfB family transposase